MEKSLNDFPPFRVYICNSLHKFKANYYGCSVMTPPWPHTQIHTLKHYKAIKM